MGELEGRSNTLSRRARQRATGRKLREAITRLSTEELEAMLDHFEEHGRDDEAGWQPVDEPLMGRLVQVRDEMRAEKAEGDFFWRAKTKRGEYGDEAADEG